MPTVNPETPEKMPETPVFSVAAKKNDVVDIERHPVGQAIAFSDANQQIIIQACKKDGGKWTEHQAGE